MIFCKKKKIKVFHKMIAILIFQLFLFSSLGYIRPDHAFKNDTGTLRVPIGQAIDRMNYLSHDPAIRFQGVGLGKTKFNIEGHEVIIDLHIILNAALAYSTADSKNLKIEEVLPSALLRELPEGYQASVSSLLERIEKSHSDTQQVNFRFIPFLRKKVSQNISDAIIAQLRSKGADINSENIKDRVALIADTIASDIVLHPGTGGGRKTPTVYADLNQRWLLDRLNPELRARIVIHGLLHLALRLESDTYLSEREVQTQDAKLSLQYTLMPFDEALRQLNVARSDRLEAVLEQKSKLITKRMAKTEEAINIFKREYAKLKEEFESNNTGLKDSLALMSQEIERKKLLVAGLGKRVKELNSDLGKQKSAKKSFEEKGLVTSAAQLEGIIKARENKLAKAEQEFQNAQADLESSIDLLKVQGQKLESASQAYKTESGNIEQKIQDAKKRLGAIKKSADLLDEQIAICSSPLEPLNLGETIEEPALMHPAAKPNPVDTLNLLLSGTETERAHVTSELYDCLRNNTTLGSSVISSLINYMVYSDGLNELSDLQRVRGIVINDRHLEEIKIALEKFEPTKIVQETPAATSVVKEITPGEAQFIRLQAAGIVGDYDGFARFCTLEEYTFLKYNSKLKKPIDNGTYSKLASFVDRVRTRHDNWVNGTAITAANLPREARFLVKFIIKHTFSDVIIADGQIREFAAKAIDPKTGRVKHDIREKFEAAIKQNNHNPRISTLLIRGENNGPRYELAYDDIERLIISQGIIAPKAQVAAVEEPKAALQEEIEPIAVVPLEETAAAHAEERAADSLLKQEIITRAVELQNLYNTAKIDLENNREIQHRLRQELKRLKIRSEEKVSLEMSVAIDKLVRLKGIEVTRQQKLKDIVKDIMNFVAEHQEMADLFKDVPSLEALSGPRDERDVVIDREYAKDLMKRIGKANKIYLSKGESELLESVVMDIKQGVLYDFMSSRLDITEYLLARIVERAAFDRELSLLEERLNAPTDNDIFTLKNLITDFLFDAWVHEDRKEIIARVLNNLSPEHKKLFGKIFFRLETNEGLDLVTSRREKESDFDNYYIRLLNALAPDYPGQEVLGVLPAEVNLQPELQQAETKAQGVAKLLSIAKEAETRKDLLKALSTYEQAWELAEGIAAEYKRLFNIDGISDDLAEELIIKEEKAQKLADSIIDASQAVEGMIYAVLEERIASVAISMRPKELEEISEEDLVERVIKEHPDELSLQKRQTIFNMVPAAKSKNLAILKEREKSMQHDRQQSQPTDKQLRQDLADAINTVLDRDFTYFGRRIRDGKELSDFISARLFRSAVDSGLGHIFSKARESIRHKSDEGANGFEEPENIRRLTYFMIYIIRTDRTAYDLFSQIDKRQLSFEGASSEAVSMRSDASFIAEYDKDLRILGINPDKLQHLTAKDLNRAHDHVDRSRTNQVIREAWNRALSGRSRYVQLKFNQGVGEIVQRSPATQNL